MNELVTKNQAGELVITSLQIANLFEKQPSTVNRSIRNYINDVLDGDSTACKIVRIDYIDKNGDLKPMYELSETEALIITGRFTGKVAAKHQRRIAEQFITMRDYIRNLESSQLRITTDQLLELQKKRAFESISDNCMKSIIEERNNNKVSEVTNLMAELGIIQITDAVRHYKKITNTDMGQDLGVVIVNNTPCYPEVMHERIRDIVDVKEILRQKIDNLSQCDVFGYA